MEKKVVLFVDDEPNILSGLKRMLRPLRKELDMHFVGSGKEALEFMEEHHTDIIVSDMRMPSMDGAMLLKKVQIKHPNVMRLVLSGHADQEAIYETVGVAHQFLAKPTSAEQLKETLLRAGSLQRLLSNPSLIAVITKVGDLPSLPTVYRELEEKLKNAECSVEDVATVIEKDMGMSAKVLQLVNSAFFGLFTHVESPARAVNLLGLDTIKALVLSVGVFSEVTHGALLETIGALWEHSVKVAAFARHICKLEKVDKEMMNDAFIAGMLHDVGKMLFIISDDIDYEAITKDAKANGLAIDQAERKHIQSDHAEAGAYLTGLWGLPGTVIEGIAFHHRISEYPVPTFSPALAVHAADAIYNQLHPAQIIGRADLDLLYLEEAGLQGRIDVWREQCEQIKFNVS